MKAAVVRRYGGPEVVEVREVPKPSPGPGEVLVRVHAATVNRSDCGERAPHPAVLGHLFFGLFRPRRRIFGLDFAGVVEAVGEGATAFRPGDRVFGLCPLGRDGAHAEYLCMPETGFIAAIPAGMAFEEAVIGEGAVYAHATLRKLGLKPGDRLLIYGASGAIGTAAVQLARPYGAEVTAVVATRHLELARSLGADRVIDYTAGGMETLEGGFDAVLDAVGKLSMSQWKRLLKPGGVFTATDMGPGGQNLFAWLWSSLGGRPRVAMPAPERGVAQAFLPILKAEMDARRIHGVFDRTYPLDAIAEAYRHVETGQKTGIVVIQVAPPEKASAVRP